MISYHHHSFKMEDASSGSSVAVVKISHQDLIHTARKMKTHENEGMTSAKEENHRNQTKKPQLPVYRPGIGLVKKGSSPISEEDNNSYVHQPRGLKSGCDDEDYRVADDPSLNNEVNSAVEKLETLDLGSNTSSPIMEKKNRTKRPDMQLYIPKPRSNMMRDEERKKNPVIVFERSVTPEAPLPESKASESVQKQSPVSESQSATKKVDVERRNEPTPVNCDSNTKPNVNTPSVNSFNHGSNTKPNVNMSSVNAPNVNNFNHDSNAKPTTSSINAPSVNSFNHGSNSKPNVNMPSANTPSVNSFNHGSNTKPNVNMSSANTPSVNSFNHGSNTKPNVSMPSVNVSNYGPCKVPETKCVAEPKSTDELSQYSTSSRSEAGSKARGRRSSDDLVFSGSDRSRKSQGEDRREDHGRNQRQRKPRRSSEKPRQSSFRPRPGSTDGDVKICMSSSNRKVVITNSKLSSSCGMEMEDWESESMPPISRAISQEDVTTRSKESSETRIRDVASTDNWERSLRNCADSKFSKREGSRRMGFVASLPLRDSRSKVGTIKEEPRDGLKPEAIKDVDNGRKPVSSSRSRGGSSKETEEPKQSDNGFQRREKKPKLASTLDWSEEVERTLALEENKQHKKSSPNVSRSYEAETSDVDTPESPMPPNKRKRNTKRRRHQRQKGSGTDSQISDTSLVSSKSCSGRSRNSSGNKPSGNAGILRLPLPQKAASPSADGPSNCYPSRDGSHTSGMQQRHLFDPKNPNNPQVVYKPSNVGESHDRGHPHHAVDGYSYQDVQGGRNVPNSLNNNNNVQNAMCAPVYAMHGNYLYHSFQGTPESGMYYPVPSNGQVEFPAAGYSKLSVAQRNIKEAVGLENELNCHLTRSFDAIDHKKLSQCRWKIQVRYENSILSDVEYCTRNNVEQALWKSAYYQVIETFRKHMIDQPALKDDIRKALLSLIEEGVIFYENLLEKLQETFGFTLAAFLDSDALRTHPLRQVKMALMSAQKIIICLGDLARYREQANETSNYGKARSWYLKAQQLAPKNGRPYNQLAILALYARRKLDAVYFYMRSLAASNPFSTARESLLSLFDEARKKYEQVEKKRNEERLQHGSNRDLVKENQPKRLEGRYEVWVVDENHTTEAMVNGADAVVAGGSDDELQKLSTVDLNKKFILSFLHTHGKLFAKIGMETFVETSVQMLQEFHCLLRHIPIPVSGSRLLQLMAINMFTLYHTELKDTSLEPNCRSLLQEHALQVSLEMFGVLLQRCLVLLKQQLASTGTTPAADILLTDDLQNLVPPIKVWCDWLMCHPGVWNPPPSQSEYRGSNDKDAWALLAELVSITKTMDMGNIEIRNEPADGWEPIILPEDTTLAGFVPLLTLPADCHYASVAASYDKEAVRNVLRLNRLHYCADYLCGIVPPVLCYDVQRKAFMSLVTDNEDSSSSDDGCHPAVDHHMMEEKESSDDCSSSDDSSGSPGNSADIHPSSQIQQLRSRKEQLRKRKRRQEKQKQRIQAVLHETRSSLTILEIHPQYLIPDTNCFIDHLDHVKQLVEMKRYQLTVPLVVVNELEGLAKGCRPATAGESHSVQVTRGAKAALEYLDDVFGAKNAHVRAATAKGSELDTITFRSEDIANDNVGTNDDLILNCCLGYCDEKHGGLSFREKDGQKKMVRRVVLLTDDRNLRLKALSRDVPVRDTPNFMSMLMSNVS